LLEALGAGGGCWLLTTVLYLALRFAKWRNRRAWAGTAVWRIGGGKTVDTHQLLLGLLSQR
jgi:hypothetical protein